MKGKFTEETENREDFAEDGPRVSGVTMEGYKRAGEWVTIKSGDLPNMRTWVFKMRNDRSKTNTHVMKYLRIFTYNFYNYQI